MAVKKILIGLGDSNCAGNTASSGGLSTNYPGLIGARTNYDIWNFLTQAWAAYSAGVNSYTLSPGSALYGPEVDLRDHIPTALMGLGEKLSLFKCGVFQSSLLKWNDSINDTGGGTAGVNYSCWWPGSREAIYTVFRQNLATAVAALQSGGNTVECVGVYLIFGTLDALAPRGSKAFGDLLLEFAEKLFADLATLGVVVTGTRCVFIKTHRGYVVASDVLARLENIRIGTEFAKDNFQNQLGRIVRTDSLPVGGDHVHFSMDSNVLLGTMIGGMINTAGDSFQRIALSEPINPIDLYVLLGDDHAVGFGISSDLPDYMALDSGFDGVKIFRPYAVPPQFTALSIGTNNQPTYAQEYIPAFYLEFGPEYGLGEAARRYHKRTIHLLKLGISGSFISKSEFPSAHAASYPFFSSQCNDWNPASHNELFDKYLTWFYSAIDKLEADFGSNKVRLRGVLILLGTNDSSIVDGGLQASEVQGTLKSIIRRIREYAYIRNIADPLSPTPMTLVMPDARYVDRVLQENHTLAVRAAIRAVAEEDDRVALLDPPPSYKFRTSPPNDIHYDGPTNLQLGSDAFDALINNLIDKVKPLFNSRDQLVSRLRLQDVPKEQNAQDVIDEAIQLVKTNFYRSLGRLRIEFLQSLVYTPAPQNDADYLRLLAATTETKWVRLELIRTMPLQFVDGSAADQTWQNEAAFRTATIAQLVTEMKKIRTEIDEAIDILSGAMQPTEDSRIKITAIGPLCDPANPGDTVRVQGGVF